MKTKKHLKNSFTWPAPDSEYSFSESKNTDNSMNNFNWFARYDKAERKPPTEN